MKKVLVDTEISKKYLNKETIKKLFKQDIDRHIKEYTEMKNSFIKDDVPSITEGNLIYKRAYIDALKCSLKNIKRLGFDEIEIVTRIYYGKIT
jgi:hypothetical protein